jgi:hypothetical protein
MRDLTGGSDGCGGGYLGGFYFFQQAGMAETAIRLCVDGHGKTRIIEAPTTTFGLTGHGRAALGALGLHEESMARRDKEVKRERPQQEPIPVERCGSLHRGAS